MFIPDESGNVSSLLNYRRTQVNTLSDSTPSFEDLVNRWFGSWALVGKAVNDFRNCCLNLFFFFFFFSLACAYIVAVASTSKAVR